jgi:acetolactate synthase-1/3 small subunit
MNLVPCHVWQGCSRHVDPSLSRMTIVTHGSEEIIEQITKQLNKLVDVVKLADITEGGHLERELMLIKVRADSHILRDETKRVTDIFRGRILDVTDDTYTIELTGSGDKLDAFINALNTKCIIETVRSGATGISRGARALHV